jgi:hypothetical protein
MLAAGLTGVAVAATFVDLLAQVTVIQGLMAAHMGLNLPTLPTLATTGLASLYGLAALPELLAALPTADRVSLACAGTSCVTGLLADAIAAVHEHAAEEAQQTAGSDNSSVDATRGDVPTRK